MTAYLVKSLLLATILTVAAAASAAQAQVAITNPTWTRRPQAELATELLPGFANMIGVSGTATIKCTLVEDGHPFRCDVTDETVPGLGFGSAARLVVASGEIRTRRVDGVASAGEIVTHVRFATADLDTRGKSWTGPEPDAATLELASKILDRFPQELVTADQMMDGLDFDRRAVVGPWIEELAVPSLARQREIRIIQIARLFGSDGLQNALSGSYPRDPGPRAFMDACPEMTPAELAGIKELRRRYCTRYGCGPET